MTRCTHIAVLVLSVLLVLASCSDAESGANSSSQVDFSDGGHTYTVHGIVEVLPSEGPPPSALKIAHEHIPDFVGNKGTVHVNRDGSTGMKAMAMEFPDLAPGLSLDGLAVGNKVEFTFRVKWVPTGSGDPIPRWQVTGITRLPDETPISFGNTSHKDEAAGGATDPDGP